ncbi:multicopper oxidase [Apiospora saccharicola]
MAFGFRKSLLIASAAWLSVLSTLSEAATVTYDFDVAWALTASGPSPQITCNIGDRVVVHVTNSLGNQSTSLHFHGLFQNGTTHMDGPPQVSQCDIPPGHKLTYDFTVDQPGTYWYHSHTRGQYPDGLRGPFIVHDPKSPFAGQYDEELVLSVSDWYHEQIHNLLPAFISKGNPTGAEPVPNNALFNETQNLKVPVQPGKTYLVRMVNIGAFAGQYVWFEGHNMTIVEVDGVYTQPAEAEMIYMTAAQRYSFLLTTKNETKANYAFSGSMDTTLFDTIPDDLNWNVTGWLVYDDSEPFPEPAVIEGDEFNAFDDMELVPFDNQTLLGEPDQTIQFDVIMDNLGDGANYAFFNNITYTAPKVPTLYTALTSGELANDATVYGEFTNSHVLQKDQIIQIVVNNLDTGRHPFHLHGHQFQTIHRSAADEGTFDDTNTTMADFPKIPMRRDTVVLEPNGNVVLRFKADNPGVWIFHCHLEWHVASGLIATFVESPKQLQDTIKLPQDHLNICAEGHIPISGNAAGNTIDLLDLDGQNRAPDPLPAGFTARGIVALVFSCVCGILGVVVVAWYGLAPDPGTAGPALQSDGNSTEDDGQRGGVLGAGDKTAGAPVETVFTDSNFIVAQPPRAFA